jgi:hypothetical protein
MALKKPKTDDLSLIGRCFVIWGDDMKVPDFQGIVRGRPEPGYYLVQYFEALMGTPSTFAIFSIAEMKHGRLAGCFEFFEDDQHLREWSENRR